MIMWDAGHLVKNGNVPPKADKLACSTNSSLSYVTITVTATS